MWMILCSKNLYNYLTFNIFKEFYDFLPDTNVSIEEIIS